MIVRKHECARCGKTDTADKMVFSAHTRNHYCASIDSCGRRAHRAALAAARSAA